YREIQFQSEEQMDQWRKQSYNSERVLWRLPDTQPKQALRIREGRTTGTAGPRPRRKPGGICSSGASGMSDYEPHLPCSSTRNQDRRGRINTARRLRFAGFSRIVRKHPKRV